MIIGVFIFRLSRIRLELLLLCEMENSRSQARKHAKRQDPTGFSREGAFAGSDGQPTERAFMSLSEPILGGT